MLRRKRVASNRHWVFVKEEILGPLNDQLAIRHGPEYQFEVPEESFDWDVEFSVIKDRSGNNLREQYMDAWVQPALVAPGNAVYQLGVRINWRNQDLFKEKKEPKEDKKISQEFYSEEVSALMAKTDEILGSPLDTEETELKEEPKEEVAEQRPDTVTNQKRNKPVQLTIGSESNIHRILKIAGTLTEDSVRSSFKKEYIEKPLKIIMNSLQAINDAKSLNSLDMQQIEVQNAYDNFSDLRDNQFTAMLSFVAQAMADKLRDSDIQDEDIYDMLSRIVRSISDNMQLLLEPDQKILAINNVETDIMNLFNDQNLNEVITSYFKGIEINRLKELFSIAEKQIKALRDVSLKLNISKIPAPQIIDQYVEEIKENPAD